MEIAIFLLFIIIFIAFVVFTNWIIENVFPSGITFSILMVVIVVGVGVFYTGFFKILDIRDDFLLDKNGKYVLKESIRVIEVLEEGVEK